MKPKNLALALGLLGALSLNCQRDHTTAPVKNTVREMTTLEKQVAAADNIFGINLFKAISDAQPDSNLFISPLSVSYALGMTLNGAVGQTYEDMQNTLGFADLSEDQINETFQSLMTLLVNLDPNVQFEIANSIWYRQGFDVLQDFIDVNRTYFDAEVRSLDFSSAQAPGIINGWVSDKTHGRIEEVIDAIDPLTVMFLINAIYFKGTWTYQFEPDQTQDAQFNTLDGSQVPCRMMQMEADLAYLETPEFQAVDLPYGDEHFSMTVFLPRNGITVNDLIATITPQNWAAWLGQLSETTLTLALPKFKVEYEIKLNDVLTALGMDIAFDPGRADFSRISDTTNLYISHVRHKTFVEVDEEGTEAAAVTVVEIRYTSTGTTFRADRPFFFVIRENQADTILFIGKIVAPTS